MQNKTFTDALNNLRALEADRKTDPSKLAQALPAAREICRIAAVRQVEAQREQAREEIARLTVEHDRLTQESTEADNAASHLSRTAEGTLDGLFGPGAWDRLQASGIRPTRCIELETLSVQRFDEARQVDKHIAEIRAQLATDIVDDAATLLKQNGIA